MSACIEVVEPDGTQRPAIGGKCPSVDSTSVALKLYSLDVAQIQHCRIKPSWIFFDRVGDNSNHLDAVVFGQQVIPVIGPDLVTIAADGQASDAQPIPLHRYLAPQLAAALELDQPERFKGYNQVVREFLLHGGERKELYARFVSSHSRATAKRFCTANRA